MTIKHTQPQISISLIIWGVVSPFMDKLANKIKRLISVGGYYWITKTPLFLMGLSVSLVESTRFELVHDC